MNDDGTFHLNFSTAEASELLAKEDLKRWMHHHNRQVAHRIGDEKQSKKNFEELVQSLKLDKNPRKTASLLIGKEALIAEQPKRDLTGAPKGGVQLKYDEIIAGRIAREKISKQLQDRPHGSILSPGLLLTEARRKEILEKLRSGICVEEDAIVPLDLAADSSGHLGRDSPQKLDGKLEERRKLVQQESVKRAFRPKWEHYDTMKARWTYIQPQTKHLVPNEKVLAPSSSTCVFPVADTTITGNLVEINNFLTRSQLSVESIHDAVRSSHVLKK
jgi:hypothetical protein